MTPDVTENEYAEWEPTLMEIAASGTAPCVLVLGGMDVGKTTFTRLLVNRWTGRGQRVAIVDGDLGQSEIGPPACVGMAFANAPLLALSDLSPHALAFVGSTSPPGHLLDHAAAVRRMADLAGDCPLVVDTSGFLYGSSARRLNQIEFDLLAPAHVVALQRQGELEGILAPMRRRDHVRIHTPPIPLVIGKKPATFRRQRRAMRFAAYFQSARLHTYSFDEVAFVGAWLGCGTPVAPHLLKYLNEALGPETRVYYGEMSDRHLGLMVSRFVAHDAPVLGPALQTLRAEGVTLTVAPRLKHLLLGLEGANGKMLGLGLLEAIDFRRRSLGVLTPCRAPAAARILHMGSLRVQPDGTEAGALKPGEL
jgi:polynucleotide 5'-hydroxyl-kinase GRC3/NOL9